MTRFHFRNRSSLFLYQQFEKEKEGDKKAATPRNEKPKTGYTIYVSGKTITEEFLRKHFSEFGSIVNVRYAVLNYKTLAFSDKVSILSILAWKSV